MKKLICLIVIGFFISECKSQRGSVVAKQYIVIDSLNKDTVNWRTVFPSITMPKMATVDSFFVVMINDNFQRVAIIDDKYKLQVYDSLRTIQVLLKLLAK